MRWVVVYIITEVNELRNKKSVIAVPTKSRTQIMSLAHEKSGHFAAKKLI